MKKPFKYFLPVGIFALCGSLLLQRLGPATGSVDFLAGFGIGLSLVMSGATLFFAFRTNASR